MKQAFFDTDYMAGAHPALIEALTETNLDKTPGYGLDSYTADAERMILDACGLADNTQSRVYFLVGGTQTNATVIDGLLSHSQGVIAAESAHVNVHESGAIEASGHKVISLPTDDGKLHSQQVEHLMEQFYADDTYEHMVMPAMVYISFPTEVGTLYSLQEIESLRKVCDRHKMPLYIDGARLFYGLMSPKCDVTLKDIARLADVFYIGGTKEGALMGEAVVIKKKAMLPRFFSLVKMHGALLAKGRLLGVQFKALFTDHLLEKITRQAVDYALEIKAAFNAAGYDCYIDSYTNQQFFLLPNPVIERLKEHVGFELWGPKREEITPVRFVTSWATTPQEVALLKTLL